MSECKAHRKNSFMPFSCENVELPIHATNVVFHKRSYNDQMYVELYIQMYTYSMSRTFKNDMIKMCIYSIMILCAHPWLLVSVFCIKRSFKKSFPWLYLNTLLLWLVFPLLFTAFLREWMHRYFESRSLYVVIFNSSAFPNTNKRSFSVK